MNVFNKRFFVFISLVFLGFTAISFEFKNLIFFPIFAISVAVFYLIISKFKKKHKNIRLVCILLLCAAALGVISSQISVATSKRLENKHCGEHTISGYIAEVTSKQNFMGEYVLRVEALDDKKVHFDLVLVTEYKSDISHGDFLKFNANIVQIESYDNYDYIKNKAPHSYNLFCAIDENVEIQYLEKQFRIPLVLSNLNSKFSSTLKALIGKEGGALASALLLGNRELLPDNALRDFKRAGVYHMLALSGLHVAILIGILDWILKKLCVVRGVRICVLTFLSLFYVALTGFALSAGRSMLMLWIMYLALTLGKKRDTMTALFIAVSVIVLINPSAIFDLGLQLSFLSTFGIICSSVICNKIRWFKKDIGTNTIKIILVKVLRKIALLNIASLCVFILTLPTLMIYFGEVSLATFISNLFMGIICEIFMICSLLTLLLSKNPYLHFPFAEASACVGEFMNDVVSFISNMDGVMLSLSYPRIEILVWGLFISFVVLLAIRMARKWIIFVPSIAFAILLCVNIGIYRGSRNDFLRAEYLQGDNLILSSANEVYICNMSDGSYGGLFESVEIAKENCFTKIDGIVISHYHSSHIMSLEGLAQNYKIGAVYLPMPQNPDEDLIMRSIVRVLLDEGVYAYVYENGRELGILSGKLCVSPRAYVSEYAHPSVAISFAYGDERITLLGKPYFETYLEKSELFKEFIEDSDYLIFGADGRNPQNEYEIFSSIKKDCEISFSDFDLMNQSDFENYLDEYKIYFDVKYKKYDLK